MEAAMWQEKGRDDDVSDGASSTSPDDRKRKHKDKKRKKDKKHKRNHREKSSDDAEKGTVEVAAATSATSATREDVVPAAAVAQPVVDDASKREAWMGDSETSFLFPSVLQQDLRRNTVNPKIAAREAQQRETERLYKARELNPSIHDKESGDADETISEKPSLPGAVVGDGGASWLKKAYRRLEEQAEDRGCSVAEVAAERFGSLEQLKNMIAAAEIKEGMTPSGKRETPRSGADHHRRLYEHRRPGRDDDRHSSRQEERRQDSAASSSQGHYQRERRNFESNQAETTRHDSRDKRHDSRRDEEASNRGNRPRSRERSRDRSAREDGSASSDKGRPGFVKPGEDRRSAREDGSASSDKVRPGFVKPGEDLPSSWKSRDKVQYVPKSNYTPAEKKAQVDAADRKEAATAQAEIASKKETDEDEPGLSPAELNQLNARVLRAELMGDSDTVAKLKAKIASGGKGPPVSSTTKRAPESIVLSREHSKGFSYPVKSAPEAPTTGKRPKTATHNAAGEREKYFADDDKYSLSQLVSMEKMQSADDQNSLFSRLAGKVVEKVDDDYGMDDAFLKKALSKESLDQMNSRDRDKAIMEHRQMNTALGTCLHCMEGPKFPRHLVIAVGKKALLMLPTGCPLTAGHCLICPVQHVCAATSLDEDVWEEMQTFRRALVGMFEKNGEDCVFLETSMDLKRHPHMVWECIPLEIETGSMAPMYFKKAILEAEGEWTQNVKLVDLSKKDIRHAVPKNFPYFSVDFGMQGGYAHVIEDERKFQSYFGREIIGGMIDAEPRLWLKHVPINFNDQMKNVNAFNKMWESCDFTDKRQS